MVPPGPGRLPHLGWASHERPILRRLDRCRYLDEFVRPQFRPCDGTDQRRPRESLGRVRRRLIVSWPQPIELHVKRSDGLCGPLCSGYSLWPRPWTVADAAAGPFSRGVQSHIPSSRPPSSAVAPEPKASRPVLAVSSTCGLTSSAGGGTGSWNPNEPRCDCCGLDVGVNCGPFRGMVSFTSSGVVPVQLSGSLQNSSQLLIALRRFCAASAASCSLPSPEMNPGPGSSSSACMYCATVSIAAASRSA